MICLFHLNHQECIRIIAKRRTHSAAPVLDCCQPNGGYGRLLLRLAGRRPDASWGRRVATPADDVEAYRWGASASGRWLIRGSTRRCGRRWKRQRKSICALQHTLNRANALDRVHAGVSGVHPMARRSALGVSWSDTDPQPPWATPSWSPVAL